MPLFTTSPFSFLVLFSYTSLLLFQCSFDSLEVLWVLMELLTFVFVGIALTTSGGSFLSYGVVSYFITQRILSIVLLLTIFSQHFMPLISSYTFVLVLTILAKIGGVPFSGWYFSSLSFFPPFIMLIALTIHKLPLLNMCFIVLPNFLASPSGWALFSAFVFTNLLVIGIISVSRSNLLSLVITTSIGNNSWLLLACVAGGYALGVFLVIYFLLLSVSFSTNPWVSSWGLLSVSGLPPFPIFFIKLSVLWLLTQQSIFTERFLYLSLTMLMTLLLSFSYIRFVFSRFSTSLSPFMGSLGVILYT